MLDQNRFADSSPPCDRARSRRALLCTVLLTLPLVACAPSPAPVAVHAPSSTSSALTPVGRCTAPEYRQFDMWAGDWDVYDRDTPATPAARAHVDAVVGGCALREVYEQNDGLVGESYTFYDTSRKSWHHTWVTNKGQNLEIEGNPKGEAIVLQGMHRGGNAPDKTVRMSWQREADGGVREWAESSTDGGASWKPMFDMVFRRHVPDARVGQAP
jgi:hypothetical protein